MQKERWSFSKNKNTSKYEIFFKYSEKMVFPRNSHLTTIFFVISGKMMFLFSIKYNSFSLGGKWKKMIFIKQGVKIWYFLYVCVSFTSTTLPYWQKKKMPLSGKNTPRVEISGITGKDDIHAGKYVISSDISYLLTP